MKNLKLSEKELRELKGGVADDGAPAEALPGDLAKRNVNRSGTCTCNFENFSAVKNINKVEGCVCWCV